jgi:hypothetical protein
MRELKRGLAVVGLSVLITIAVFVTPIILLAGLVTKWIYGWFNKPAPAWSQTVLDGFDYGQ